MNFWQLFRLFRQFPVARLLNFPEDFSDSRHVRTWVRAIVESVQVVAELTDTEIDDKILATVLHAIDSDVTWDTVHGLLVKLIGKRVAFFEPAEAVKLSAIIGISPTLIMLIVQAVRILLDFLWNRK